MGLSDPLSVLHAFETSHVFGTVYARILKFHVSTAYEKIADPYFFSFLSDSSVRVKSFFRLANENLGSKISKESFELGP